MTFISKGAGDPTMKNHYRGHKMALWLNLIPQLHQSGGPDVVMLHHNFREERPEFYEGNLATFVLNPILYRSRT